MRKLAQRRSADFTVYAEPTSGPRNFIAVDFVSVRDTNGDLFPMAINAGGPSPGPTGMPRALRDPNALFGQPFPRGAIWPACVVITELGRSGDCRSTS